MQHQWNSALLNGKFGRLAWIGLVILCLMLGSAVVIPIAAQETTPVAPPQVGLRPDAPTYALHGPYWVGTQSFALEGEDNPQTVRVWYPALNPEGAAEATIYVISWAKYQLDSTSDIAGRALLDAAPDLNAGPYPLVVFSHGLGTEDIFYAWLVEHLASYGFVVIGPNHQEFTDETSSDLVRTTVDRPLAITHTIDYAATLTAPDGALAGLIDMERIAVAGQSYGGYTALAAAGARYDMNAFAERCAGLAEDDPNQFLCVFANSQEQMAELAGLDAVPADLWPSVGDPRVDTIVTIAGDSYMFGEQGLTEISMPVLAIGGTLDSSTPYTWGVRPTYDNIASQQKILVTLTDADHFVASTSCADAPSIADLAFYFCSDPVWDMNRAHDLMNHFITAFLLDILTGDTDAHAALAAEAVSFPGIIYEAQGF
jgi:predicted dienelactone hydrolase